MRRLTVKLKRDEALKATPVAVGGNAFAYFLINAKRVKYRMIQTQSSRRDLR